MIFLLLSLAVVAIALLLTERLWKAKKLKGEEARKLMHILTSVLIATLPAYLSWQAIQIILALGVLGILYMRLSGGFRSMYDIKRRSWGDVLGPLTIAVMAFFEPPVLLFVAVVLHIGLADGLAAIIGTRFGKTNGYTVLGYKKSVAGSLACFFTSFAIMVGIFLLADVSASGLALIVIPFWIMLAENIGLYGIDNTLIALSIIAGFQIFAVV